MCRPWRRSIRVPLNRIGKSIEITTGRRLAGQASMPIPGDLDAEDSYL